MANLPPGNLFGALTLAYPAILSAGLVAAPASYVIASQEFLEPSWTMPDLRGWRLNAGQERNLEIDGLECCLSEIA